MTLDTLRQAWARLTPGRRMVVLATGATLAAALLSSPLYAAGLLVIGAGAYRVARLQRSVNFRVLVILGAALVILGGLRLATPEQLSADAVPQDNVKLSLNSTPTLADARQLVQLAPSASETWLLMGSLEPPDRADLGRLEQQRALFMDPSQKQAALNLAALYLASARSSHRVLDEEIAAYYTSIAGYPAPPNPPLPAGP